MRGEKRNHTGFWLGKTKEKGPLGRPWRKYQGNIKRDLKKENGKA
jgi:hypothetical protein